MDIEILESQLLEAIIEELNRKQGIPMSFMDLTLEELSENHFRGKLKCSEPRRIFELDLSCSIKGQVVEWSVEPENIAYFFELS